MSMYRVLFTIIFGFTVSAYAMEQAFDKALETGTREAVEQCVRQHNIDLNRRCIDSRAPGEYQVAYPLEYVFLQYARRLEIIKNLYQILIDLGVSIDGYFNYNPLLHALCTHNDEVLKILLELKANPKKEVLSYLSNPTTPLKYVEDLIEQEKHARVRLHDNRSWLQKVHTWLSDPSVLIQANTELEKLKRNAETLEEAVKIGKSIDKKLLDNAQQQQRESKVTRVLGITMIIGVLTLTYYLCRDKSDAHTDEQAASEDMPDTPHEEVA